MNDQEYQYLKGKILKLTNINLDSYKNQQMRRRLNMFFANTGAENIVDYGNKLERNQDMLQELRSFLTINVTEFFRDASSFEQLKTSILPQLLKNSPRLHIWSAGCSHGAEPYTIALILETITPYHNHRILATDIDVSALKRAKAGGPYGQEEVRNISSGLIRKYFSSSNGSYMISDKIRQRVEFRQQNLLCEEFKQGFDLIICRNVTIYFTDEAKKELNQKFFSALKYGGVLFIGGTEVMLDVASSGFKGMGVSFYQKPAPSSPNRIETGASVLLKT